MPETEMMKLKLAKKILVKFSGKQKLHPTIGYRLWAGRFEASEPIVSLTIMKVKQHITWTRSSHKTGNSLEMNILFSPISQDSRNIQVSYCIADACTYAETVVESALTQPAPDILDHFTGEIVDIGLIHGIPLCELKALFMVRSDVKSVRNAIWHARVTHLEGLEAPWKTMLSYGRTGKYDTT